MPWWLLGVSMVATTFSTDTPNLVAGLVRENGVSGNWGWWGFLLSGMLTVFVFAKLWRRSEVLTDVEFYELRFSGKPAAFLRGFRSLYLGLVFNVLIMGSVSLAVVKFGDVVMGIEGWVTLSVAGVVTLAYSSLGGLKGVIWTDFVQFILAMVGSIWAVIYVVGLDSVGGIETILTHSEVIGKHSIFPDFADASSWIPILLVPLAVTWWATYYPGAEPGGGGYIVQRMLSAKDEKNAVGATFFFNVAHYALRPWPWIIIALASIVLVPMKIDSDYSKGHLKPVEKAITAIDTNLKPDAYPKMAAALDREIVKISEETTKLQTSGTDKQKENNLTKLASANRLRNLISSNPDALEIRALAYIWQDASFDSDNKSYKADDKQASALTKEGLVHMYLANGVPLDKLGHDLGYPTMIKLLPSGLLGLVAASLIAAFMSTMSTQVNLGASYLVNDFYARFINKEASSKQLVNVGRVVTVLMLILGSGLGLILTDSTQAFKILLTIGAGTGLVYILRWFWWRVSAVSEIAAMASALVVSTYTGFFMKDQVGEQFMKDHEWHIMLFAALITTAVWVIVTLVTKPTEKDVLYRFYNKVQPGGPGWKKIVNMAKAENVEIHGEEGWDVPLGILCTLFSSAAVYTALFATGNFIYGDLNTGLINLSIFAVTFFITMSLWKKMKVR